MMGFYEGQALEMPKTGALDGEEVPVDIGTEVEILTLDEEDATAHVKVLSGFLSGQDIWIDLDRLTEEVASEGV